MADSEKTDQTAEGIREAKAGNTVMALMSLEKAVALQRTPEGCAWLGYCLAKERGAFGKALELCRAALETAPRNPDLYLALGKVYLSAGRKGQALNALRKGLKMGRNDEIIGVLRNLGVRRQPVLSSLPRENPVNIYTGLLLHKLGMR
ncbi:MAG: tetratricopeptide repeat protein [Desulfuromonadales bacterium]